MARPKQNEFSYKEYLKIGMEYSKVLPAICTLKELAVMIGTTEPGAHQASIVALGKLVVSLKQLKGYI